MQNGHLGENPITLSAKAPKPLFEGEFGKNEEEIIRRLRKLPPLEEDPAWRDLEKPMSWGVKDASRRIDEALYGG